MYRAMAKSDLNENGSMTTRTITYSRRLGRRNPADQLCLPPIDGKQRAIGPVMVTWLAKYLIALPRRRATIIVIAPETIGAIAISKHLETLRKNVKAGYVVTCVRTRPGDFSGEPTGDTLADRAALQVLGQQNEPFKHWTYARRASDERQYCAPGVGLP